jgi:hypothetical protein
MNVVPLYQDGMKFILDNAGLNTSVIVYNSYVSGTDYDDVLTTTITGSQFVSGVILPIRGKLGSQEAVLLEQGKVTFQDKVLYTGSFTLATSGVQFKNGSNFYGLINDGHIQYDVAGTTIYNKFFLRHMPNGSVY